MSTDAVTVLKPGKLPVMPPHAWFGTCLTCHCEVRVDSFIDDGPPVPPPPCLDSGVLKDPSCAGYDSRLRQFVPCPTKGCNDRIMCVRKAIGEVVT